MNVDRLTLTHVRIPLKEPFRISNGSVSEKEGILIQVHADGLVGVGEASPMSGSFYSDDTPESVWADLCERLIPALLSSRVSTVDAVNILLDGLGGSPFARAGVETAFWDLEGQASGRPLYELLGGKRKPIDSGLAVGIYPSVPELLDAIERNLAEGYKRVKIKIQPGWDVGPLTAVRKRFGGFPLMVDANCAYTREHLGHLQALDEFGLIMLEQPLAREDLEGHAELQRITRTPICLDESAENIDSVKRAIEMKSCKIINIKIQRVGGLRNAVAIHNFCAAAGMRVWAGTMPELGIGGGQTLHLATLPNFAFPMDVESSLRWFTDDLVEPFITVKNGIVTIPRGAGNGFRLCSRTVERYRIAEQVFHS